MSDCLFVCSSGCLHFLFSCPSQLMSHIVFIRFGFLPPPSFLPVLSLSLFLSLSFSHTICFSLPFSLSLLLFCYEILDNFLARHTFKISHRLLMISLSLTHTLSSSLSLSLSDSLSLLIFCPNLTFEIKLNKLVLKVELPTVATSQELGRRESRVT